MQEYTEENIRERTVCRPW